MDIQTIAIIFLAAISAAGVVYALFYPMLSGQARAEERRKGLTAKMANPQERLRETRNRRDEVAQSLKELDQREKAKGKLTLETRLSQAGLTWTRRGYFIFCGISALVVGVLAFVLSGSIIFLPIGLIIGFLGVPAWFLSFRKKRRMAKFLNEFPNALDVITRGVKSGLPLNDCIRMIATESPEPVKSEFRKLVEAQSFGIALSDAIIAMYDRLPLPEVNYFGIIIAIQQKSGGSLAETLGNMAKVVRDRKKLKGKIQALSAEAKTSAGIIAAMPISVVGMVYLTTPGYIALLWQTQTGLFVLLGCGVWMLTGVMIMRKMIQFDF